MAFNATSPVAIGRYETEPPSRYFDGLIDEVRIYDNALSNEEVQEIFNIL